LLPALIALRTCLGAFAGGIAVPSDRICAVPLGAVGVVVLVLVLPGVVVPPVCAIAGTAQISEAMNRAPISLTRRLPLSVFDRKPFSFVGLRG